MSSWKDPLLTENDILDIIMSHQCAVRCGDLWFVPSFFGCCMIISDKIG